MKVEIDSFSGYKIYPSRGKLYVRGDSKVRELIASMNGANTMAGLPLLDVQVGVAVPAAQEPAQDCVDSRLQAHAQKGKLFIAYRNDIPTVAQGIAEETVKKRSRKTVKHQRGIVGADLAAIQAKRNQTAADRERARADAIAKAKADKKKKEDAKTKAKPATRAPTGAPKVSKQGMKGGKGGR